VLPVEGELPKLSGSVGRHRRKRPSLVRRANLESKYYDLYSGLVRLHVLYHANQEPVFGLGMIQELNRHGYKLGPGTMYRSSTELEREVG
jgi:hypothetical protein